MVFPLHWLLSTPQKEPQQTNGPAGVCLNAMVMEEGEGRLRGEEVHTSIKGAVRTGLLHFRHDHRVDDMDHAIVGDDIGLHDLGTVNHDAVHAVDLDLGTLD
jgi:hypothetical protein